MNTINQINDALVDVRKAYRLLHDYQRLAMDAAAYIGRQLDIPYSGGWSKYEARSPREGSGTLSQTPWCLLNMMFYEFHFKQVHEDGRQLLFSILLISDTGFFLSDVENPSKARTQEYAPAEQSRTCIGFLTSTNSKQWQGPAFAWNPVQMKRFIQTGGELPEEYEAAGIFGKCCDFARISSEEETSRLIDELVREFSRKGVPLKRLERKD